MRAVGIPHHGDLDVLQLFDLPVPEPDPTQVLIKVTYAGVNFRDTYVRSGLYPEKKFPFILGLEASGLVEKLPTDPKVLSDPLFKERGLQVGSRVVTLGSHTFAEYMVAPWKTVHVIPEQIASDTAVAAGVQGLTALTFMTESYNVQKDDWVLVHTAAGGLGLIFCQIAHARGARVIGTTSTPEKAVLAKQCGCDHVILYTKEDTVARVLEITEGQGVHVIYDGVGKDTWEADFKMIARKGTIVSVGNASGAVPPFPPLKLIEKNVKLLRPTVANYVTTPQESAHYVGELWKLITSGTVKITIHKEYPFSAEGVRQSQVDLVGRGTTGKLLIKLVD